MACALPSQAWERQDPAAGQGPSAEPRAVEGVGVEERLGEAVPPDLAFTDASGAPVRLSRYLDGRRPVVLGLVYYQCPMLCSLVTAGVGRAMRQSGLELGRDFRAVTVSFDPSEKPALAAERQRGYLMALGRPDATADWAFLTGEEGPIRALARSVGFHYRYDQATRQWAHPAVVVVLSPDGRVSRYLYGIDFPARSLRLALVEAARGKVGTSLDRLLLTCYRYDPTGRRYVPYALGLVRLGGLVVLAGLGGLLATLWRREAARRRA